MTAVFLQGNALKVLKGMPADFVHSAVTSPPYFGLREYDGGEEIWGGDENCLHEWVTTTVTDKRGVEGTGLNGRDPYKGGEARVDKVMGSCLKCSAWRGQLGAEPTPDLYIRHLVQICHEVRRVLRPDGVFWLNIGDSWAANRSYQVQQTKWQGMDGQEGTPSHVPDGCKPLDMVLIPQLLALALRTDGWYVRSQVVWEKTNSMPESQSGWRWEKHRVPQCPRCKSFSSFKKRVCKVCGFEKSANRGDTEARRAETGQQEHDAAGNFQSDSFMVGCPGCSKCTPNDGYALRKGSWRPTDSYEVILMLTKTSSYYCDKDAVLEPIALSTIGRGKMDFGGAKGRNYNPDENDPNFRDGSEQGGRTYDYQQSNGNGGRNLRSVWTFSTKPYSGAHFATFPEKLPLLAIQSSTSEKGCCPNCGAPWARIIEKGFTAHDGQTDSQYAAGTAANRLALLRQAARERGGEYGKLDYNSKYKKDGVTGLAMQGFQRNSTIESERESSRLEAEALYPSDERAQQDYINHDHGSLTNGKTLGWKPTCSCPPAPPESCRVLDPFAGAGTTALVCERLGLDSINIDTSGEYIELARARLENDEQKRLDEFLKKARKGK